MRARAAAAEGHNNSDAAPDTESRLRLSWLATTERPSPAFLMKARLADLGGTVLPGTPADFGKLIVEETEKWGKVIRAANIKVEG